MLKMLAIAAAALSLAACASVPTTRNATTTVTGLVVVANPNLILTDPCCLSDEEQRKQDEGKAPQ